MVLYVTYKGEGFIIIKINSVNLASLEKIGSGKFGIVYKLDEHTAYKIYHETIVDLDWKEIINPTLSLPRLHFNTLIKRSKNLLYSGGVLDTIKVDGRFRGVVIPYYQGEELLKLVDKPIDYKVELSKQMVRNAKELSNHWIYPTDYRLKNVVLSSGEIKLIDLDDCKTHPFIIPGLMFRAMSINSLGNTIKVFLKENEHIYFPKEVTDHLGREKDTLFFTFKKLDSYLDRKSEEKNIIYIDEDTSIDVINYYNLDNFDLVFLLDKDQLSTFKVKEKVEQLKEKGIEVFDFINKESQEEYKALENIGEEYELSNYELKRIYKKKK